ncbi:MAG: hypothetical protein ABJA86_03950 [Nocardioidaceae bacterium]
MKLTITVDDGNGNNAASAMDSSPTTQPQADSPDVSAGPAPSGPGGIAQSPPAAEPAAVGHALAAGETQPISAGPAPSDT